MVVEENFTSLAQKYMDTVFRLAFSYLKSRADADDVTQNVLLALYRSNELNPALSGHAQAQKRRITAQHKDGMVDSTVCGETFTHADYRFNETLLPR